ncbi:hypothetical protein PQE70_gp158 [Bacillus phage vB_BanS_Nate]|uniref:Uncharacterized protein n=1 Tax=Bacillus phage vB_BanS_Nate TaxID=2894788 RepID=A0AAE8YVX4_9CAUD|nr:hypothetical protein PQE70_gp158 [Bacillus phage vB_BanS_Nate]UGO51011.1 hypothetical protein NATE_158 [Bacillus phage vB_BanS_Nate]
MIEEYFVIVITVRDYEFSGKTRIIQNESFHKYCNYPDRNMIKKEMERWDIVIDGKRAVLPLHAKVEKRYSYKGD